MSETALHDQSDVLDADEIILNQETKSKNHSVRRVSTAQILDQAPKEEDIFSNPNYIRRCHALVKHSLENGADVMQMPNGDVVIMEVKTVISTYKWNKEKGRMIRMSVTDEI
jgi:hypothetical protein